MPVSIRATEWISKHQKELVGFALPAIPDDAFLAIATDKLKLARFGLENNLPIPAFTEMPSDDVAEAIEFPALLKRRKGQGGNGIQRVEYSNQLTPLLEDHIEISQYFLQSYISGTDISCGMLCRDGRVLMLAAYTCIGRASEYGPFNSIEFIQDDEVEDLVSRLAQQMNWNGIVNVDLRRSTDGRLYILEMNPRVWANTLGAFTAGINFSDSWCRTALNEPIEKPTFTMGCYYGLGDAVVLLKASVRQFLLGDSSSKLFETLLKRSALPFMICDPIASMATVWLSIKRQGASVCYRRLMNRGRSVAIRIHEIGADNAEAR